jgi:hypothetical protein
MHALQRSRRGNVNPMNAPVRYRAAQDSCMQHAFGVVVVHEFAASAQQTKVFDALDWPTDGNDGHKSLSRYAAAPNLRGEEHCLHERTMPFHATKCHWSRSRAAL